ncbi:MAG: polysaccharide deacetylase family protein [Leptolyngbya sp. RL_3_1]|nr:polysaccharide deacetylase family protein [Leptolyngbya sp. RL_3_1]
MLVGLRLGLLGALLGSLLALGFGFGRVQRSLLPWAETWFPEAMFRVAVAEPLVVLTIDDGLSDRTPEILDLLDRYDAKATFLCIRDPSLTCPRGQPCCKR